MKRPRVTMSDTPLPDGSRFLFARTADDSPSPPAPPHRRLLPSPLHPPGRSLATCSNPLPTFANGSPATSHPTFPTPSPAMDHFPEDQQRKQADPKMLVQRLRQMGDHTGLRHQSPTGTSRRALGRTSANLIQTRVIGPGPHPGRGKPLLPLSTAHRQRRTAKQHNFWQHHCRQFLTVLRFTLRFFPTDDVTARHFCSWLLAQLQLLDVCHLSCGSGRLKALLARLGLDSPASDFSSQLVPSAVYLRFTSHPKWQTFFYVGATRTSLMARDRSRFHKLLQVQRHHLVNAELAVRWWAHFDVFHFYASLPIHIAVPATDLFATEQFYIATISQFWLHRETFSATHGLHTTIGLFSIPAHGLCHHLAKAPQTTTTNRSATSFPSQAHEQPPGLVAPFRRSWQQRPTTIRFHPLHTEQRLPTRCPIHPSSHRYTLT